MSLHPTAPHPIASGSAASAIAAPARPKARAATPLDDHGGADPNGFAAQLLRARPAQDDAAVADTSDAKSADKAKTKSKTDSSDDTDGGAGDDAPAAATGAARDADAKTPDAAPPAVDPNALMPWMQQLPPTTVSLAKGAAGDGADTAADALGALKKGGKGGKDALLAALGKDAKAGPAAAAAATAAGAADAAVKGATDPTAALAKAAAGADAAADTRDAQEARSLSAVLAQPDPVTVQAGTVGAAPTAVQDPNQGATAPPPMAPAQATLPMLPQSPSFGPALGHQIETWLRDGVQHAEVQLSPQDLGPIRVRIAMEGAQARVEMSADVASTREALQQALPQLSDSLGQVGVSLTGGGVSDQPSFAQSQAQAQAQAGADGRGGPTGRAGGQRGHGQGGGTVEDVAAASAARQAVQRRSLLDLYA